MKVYFIKDYINPDDGRLLKAGQAIDIWDEREAINKGFAVPYNQRHLINESFTETQATAQSAGQKKGNPAKASKTKIK